MASVLTAGADAAHSLFASALAAAPVKIGDKLPEDKTVKAAGNPEKNTSIDTTGKILIVGVPGCFTPTCSSQVPGYIEQYEEFEKKGVKSIYVLTVNDAFVVDAWKKKLVGEGKDTKVQFVADDKATYVSALGLVFDASPILGGPRSKRFALVAQDGLVTQIHIEEDPSQSTITRAENVLPKV